MSSTMITHAGIFQVPGQHEHLLERFLLAIEVLAEFCIAVMLGIAVGWLVGLNVGRAYVEYHQPVYFSQFHSLREISEWSLKPFAIATVGAYVGGLVSAIAELFVDVRSRSRT